MTPIAIQRAGREVGPVETLCQEIKFRFQRPMETQTVLIAFVRELVATVAEDRDLRVRIAEMVISPAPSEASGVVLDAAVKMLTSDEPIGAAAELHDLAHELNPEDAYPTDHVIDMLSSCASAIRFGLESPCQSRHAAEAAHHVWRQHYGVSLEDSHTPHWWHDWARSMMEQALVALAAPPTSHAHRREPHP